MVMILACAVVNWLPGTREESTDMRDLVVDVSAFPEGWALQTGPYHPPEWKHLRHELEASIAQADRFRFACAECAVLDSFVAPCKAAAQYSGYVSVFRTHTSPDYLALEEVETVL